MQLALVAGMMGGGPGYGMMGGWGAGGGFFAVGILFWLLWLVISIELVFVLWFLINKLKK